jgi:hypothetical protein
MSLLAKNPENREAPNQSELKPVVKPDTAKGIGQVAIKGAGEKLGFRTFGPPRWLMVVSAGMRSGNLAGVAGLTIAAL